MLGPILLLVIGVAWGISTRSWLGVGFGLVMAGAVIGGIMAVAATWSRQIGAVLDLDEAWRAAPRPAGFRRLCDWVYRRTLR